MSASDESSTPGSVSEQPETNESAPRAVDWDNPRVASILAAAAKCFARKGFTATTLAEIGKELGLRKSIVHYYFASKAALIHEVQSYTYHRHLDGVRAALNQAPKDDSPARRATSALNSLWGALKENRTTLWLNIEVWASARRDEELKRRAAALHQDSRKLVQEGMADVLGDPGALGGQLVPISSLIIAVLNGLSVAEYLEGEDAKADEAYQLFLLLLRLGLKEVEAAKAAAGA
ncbi:MAG: TetR/AcrR family transcriptional regulator [Polyangiaceae bacterium]|nr:TetR/AcrR family transcriptional regulator [Myxococcales bacterium]MCB9588811.1 TetR/AcrR family transcriptional regulator [Polyangiaceae bacterium]MCB9605370.1 TetR/AcrR family transcriptional regulator [Polyangiaceae bacterium]